MILVPLQQQLDPMLQEVDSTSLIIGIGILLGFILLLFIGGKSNASRPGSTTGKGKKRVPGKQLSKWQFRKKAAEIGLTKVESKTLENMIKRYRYQYSDNFLSNSTQLDALLKRGIAEITQGAASEGIKEGQKLTLYRIKQKIERNVQGRAVYSNTRQLSLNQRIVLIPESNGRYPARVSSTLQDSIGVTVPTDSRGQEIRWPKWSKLQVFFWKSNGQGYSFLTKVRGYNQIRGVSSLFLQHSNDIRQAQQRRYRRKNLDKPCYFYPVQVNQIKDGRKVRKKAVVDTGNSALGTVIEVSSGGCSIKSSYPLSKGKLIKVEFEASSNSTVTAYGKVVDARRSRPAGGIMHIMFTRLSRKHLNSINSYVYDLESSSNLSNYVPT